MEIERKFLVKYLPNLEGLRKKEVTQGYLSFEPEIRIRSMNSTSFFLTQKSDGNLIREEIETSIDGDSYQILANLVKGRIISKTRYYIPLDGNLMAELDIYYGDLEGLSTVEIEFASEEDSINYHIPDWFSKDITNDKRYKNKNLAKQSIEELDSLINESKETDLVRKIVRDKDKK